MERRWFALAISAHVKGAIDFSKITRYDQQSLFLESLVFDELERERQVDFKIAKCWYSMVNLLDKSDTIFGGWAEGERDGYYKQLFPWSAPEERHAESSNPLLRQILDGYKEML